MAAAFWMVRNEWIGLASKTKAGDRMGQNQANWDRMIELDTCLEAFFG